MDERVMQFRVGVMVVATLFVTAILVVLFGKLPSVVHRTYTIYISFPEAPGVTRDTPVRKSGIRIGRVSEVRFADDDTTVLVTALIDANRRIYHNEVCRANSSLLVGDASIEFARSRDPNAPKTPIEGGETIDGVVAGDPTRAIANLQQGLVQTMDSVDTASHDLAAVLKKIDRLLQANEQQITRVIDQADKTLQVVRDTLNNANEVLGDAKTREKFKASVEEMPEVLRSTRETVQRMGRSFALVEENLRNVEGLTRPLGERGEALVGRIDASTVKLDKLMDGMLKFSNDVNNSQGSLAQLVHNPELYQHLNRAAKNIDELTRQLKPIVDDARVFSDKIARHPESLGVRGAIQRNPGIK